MRRSGLDTAEPFGASFLQCVAYAGEAREVPGDRPTELPTEMERTRELPEEDGHALAVQDLAERVDLPVAHTENMRTALEAQPTVTREVRRRMVEAWLEKQRRLHWAGEPRG